MAQVTRVNFQAGVNSDYADGQGEGDITEQDHRDTFGDASDSALWWLDDVLDEDTMSSNSATDVPTQQSAKYYMDHYALGLKYVERTVTSAEILSLNSSPIELVAAGGANVFTSLVAIWMTMDYAGVAYATNTTLHWRRGTTSYFNSTTILPATSDTLVQYIDTSEEATTANENINLFVATGNPTAGTSDIKVKLLYKVIDITA